MSAGDRHSHHSGSGVEIPIRYLLVESVIYFSIVVVYDLYKTQPIYAQKFRSLFTKSPDFYPRADHNINELTVEGQCISKAPDCKITDDKRSEFTVTVDTKSGEDEDDDVKAERQKIEMLSKIRQTTSAIQSTGTKESDVSPHTKKLECREANPSLVLHGLRKVFRRRVGKKIATHVAVRDLWLTVEGEECFG